MSTVQRTKCDACGREVVDHYAEPGYIKADAICVSMGREVGGSGRSFTVKGDFCGLPCLQRALGEAQEAYLADEARKRIEREAAATGHRATVPSSPIDRLRQAAGVPAAQPKDPWPTVD